MKISRSTLTAIVFSILLTWGDLQAEPATLQPESKLWLVGDSTLHAYTATASSFDLKMEVATSPLYESIKQGKMTSLKVHVPVKNLLSGKNQLDRNMHKALKAEANPEIIFDMLSYEVMISSVTDIFPITAKGSLTVAGQTKSIELMALVKQGETVRISGNQDLLMTDYGVKPPSFMGAIKTHNRVVINFDLYLK